MTLALPERADLAPATMPAAVQYMPAPAGSPDGTPRVFAAIADVMRDITPVSKNQLNQAQKYKFRGIDDLMSAMAGPMRAHGLFILPEMVHRAAARDGKMTSVVLTMRYHIYGPAGDCLVATVPGEASDFADKATNKAQSAALKYLLLQVFMIPVDGKSIDDGDRDHPEPPAEHRAERQQQQTRKQRQQPRRSQRAEGGPWEQQAPPAPHPNRDYLAEATAASSPQAFAKVRADAVAAGAPPEFLAELDAIDQQKRQQTQRGPAGPTPSTAASGTTAAAVTGRATESRRPDVDDVTDAAGEGSWQGEPARQAQAEHAAAVADMYAAAHAAGMGSREEADTAFRGLFKVEPDVAPIEQLREQAATLRQIAGAA